MSRLMGIANKLKKRSPMNLMEKAQVTLSSGIEKDFRGKAGKRQVTVLSHKAWLAACSELEKNIIWTERRANLLVDDIELFQSTGKVIQIGSVKLLITGETDPCSRMKEVEQGLYDVLLQDWRGGVCCQVITEGEISLLDKVFLID